MANYSLSKTNQSQNRYRRIHPHRNVEQLLPKELRMRKQVPKITFSFCFPRIWKKHLVLNKDIF